MTDNITDLRAQLAKAEAEQTRIEQERQQRQRDAEDAHARTVIAQWPALDVMLRDESAVLGSEAEAAARAFDLPLFLEKRLAWVANRHTKQAVNDAYNNAVTRLGLDNSPKPELRHVPQDRAVEEFLSLAFDAANPRGYDRAAELIGAPEQIG